MILSWYGLEVAELPTAGMSTIAAGGGGRILNSYLVAPGTDPQVNVT